MTTMGFALSSEEHRPDDLVRYARLAEEAEFEILGVSDHFHPWTDSQGHSPFVWSVLGGIAQVTSRIEVFTAVTCPMIRTHPAIVAHAAATTAAMMPGRFALGVGTGEALNEHIFGDAWPRAAVRLEMLEEAIDVMRLLWQGGEQSHEGKHYRLENARLYTLPDEEIPVWVAAGGENAATLAGRIGQALISTSPESETVEAFRAAGGAGKPTVAQLTVCWAADEAEARRTAHHIWPNAGIKGQLSQDLPTPAHFEQAAEMVTEDDVAEAVVCGPDPEHHVEAIQEYAKAGFSHVYIHQVGPDQEGFLRFWESEVRPRL
ncbi:MAG TPA: TIGR03557 family F420-dependent LLM class oxidoreductase [Acidimicrobiales bacterium]|nr:TIGR03557 family F420-dependent LLM class oxidoreductase [Acidimicrobiales bacterium]